MYNELNMNNVYESYIVMIIKNRNGMFYPMRITACIYFFLFNNRYYGNKYFLGLIVLVGHYLFLFIFELFIVYFLWITATV